MLSRHMYMYENLSEPLQALWCKIYNANLHGHPGRHMALDQLCEKINRMAKDMVGPSATPNRIAAVMGEINVVYRVERAHDLVFETRKFDESQTGKPKLDDDVQAIWRLFDNQIPLTRQELTQSTLHNPLTGANLALANTVERQITYPRMGWEAYAKSKLSQFHFAPHDFGDTEIENESDAMSA